MRILKKVLFIFDGAVIHSNHALELVHEESGAIQGRALIPKLNYTITPNRKLQLVPGNSFYYKYNIILRKRCSIDQP